MLFVGSILNAELPFPGPQLGALVLFAVSTGVCSGLFISIKNFLQPPHPFVYLSDL